MNWALRFVHNTWTDLNKSTQGRIIDNAHARHEFVLIVCIEIKMVGAHLVLNTCRGFQCGCSLEFANWSSVQFFSCAGNTLLVGLQFALTSLLIDLVLIVVNRILPISWFYSFYRFYCEHSSRCIASCDVVSFGRIGRIVCRIGIRNGLDFLAINDPFIEPDYMVNCLP